LPASEPEAAARADDRQRLRLCRLSSEAGFDVTPPYAYAEADAADTSASRMASLRRQTLPLMYGCHYLRR